MPSVANPPSTPESQRQSARHADRLYRLQMTDPDHRRSRSRANTPPPPLPIQQPNFLTDLAANIPQVQIPDSFNAPIRHPMPVVPPMPVVSRGRSRGRGRGRGRGRAQPPPMVPVLAHSSAMPARVSAASDDPFTMNVDTTVHNPPQPAAVSTSRTEDISLRVDDIPHVQLPVGWDAPLANPVPQAPPPMPPARGSRARDGHVHGPLHDISGGNADPALNGLHRGHIAYRERQANHLAHRHAQLLKQLQLEQEKKREYERQLELLREQEWLRRNAEEERQTLGAVGLEEQRQRNESMAAELERRMAVAAAEQERERVVQQALLQERQRIAQLEADNQDYRRQNAMETARILANWRQQHEAEQEEEEQGHLQAWAAAQLA